MSSDGPGDDDFGFDPSQFGLPFLGDLGKLLGGQGGGQWEQARQLARTIAASGTTEPNVDPTVRLRYEELGEVAAMHVATTTGLHLPRDGATAVTTTTRSEWASATIDDIKPVFEALGGSLGQPVMPELEGDDPMSQMLGGLLKFLTPMMTSMTTGALVGQLGAHGFGSYELVVPRRGGGVQLIATAIDDFGRDWELDLDELRLWIAVERCAFHAVLSVPHVRDELITLITSYAGAFSNDPEALEQRFGQLDPTSLGDPEALQRLFGDPSDVIGALTSPEQQALKPRLAAILSAVIGYVDRVLDLAGERLIGGGYARLTEALRRRRVEAGPADRMVDQLLGLDLDAETVETGHAFVEGVRERAGDEGLARLWEAPGRLPTPNELAAPGLWLARIDLPDDDNDAEA